MERKNFKQKKFLMLGAFAIGALPLIATISCGIKPTNKNGNAILGEKSQSQGVIIEKDKISIDFQKANIESTEFSNDVIGFFNSHKGQNVVIHLENSKFNNIDKHDVNYRVSINGIKSVEQLLNENITKLNETFFNLNSESLTNIGNLNGGSTREYILPPDVSVLKPTMTLEQANAKIVNNKIMDVKSGAGSSSVDGAFYNQIIPAGFKIPEGVTFLDAHAFNGATFLGDFTLPSSITNIGDWAFTGAKFYGNVTLPSSIQSMSRWAFNDAIFYKNFTFNSFPSISDWAIKGVQVYGALNIKEEDLLKYNWFNDITCINGFSIPSSIDTLGSWCSNLIDDKFIIPPFIKHIQKDAFKYAVLQDGFSIPKTVETIEDGSFRSIKSGYGWFNENNQKVDTPTPGCTIKILPIVPKIETTTHSTTQQPAKTEKQIEEEKILAQIGEIKPFEVQWGSLLEDKSEWLVPIEFNAIDSETYAGVMSSDPNDVNPKLPDDFYIPSNVKLVGFMSFNGIRLPEGLTIPKTVLLVEDNAFLNAILPKDCAWFNENNQKVDTPTPGCTLKHI